MMKLSRVIIIKTTSCILSWILLFSSQLLQLQQVQSNNIPSLGGYHPFMESPFSMEVKEEDESLEELTYPQAKIQCDEEVHCAGVSKFYNNVGDQSIFFHSFLPKVPSTTYQSKKSFTLHKGAIRKGDFLSVGNKNMTVEEAKVYCEDDAKCVAFFYPIYSYRMNLATPDSITFYSSIEEIDYELSDVWYTMISNDISKAKNVDENALKFVQEMIPFPYSSCCDRTEIPTVSDIKKVDTLERISCDITREDFIKKYEMKRKPVILVGCDQDWKARKSWTYKNLVHRFDNSSEWTADFGRGDQNEQVQWEEIGDAMVNKKNFFVFDQIDLPHQKILEKDYEIPTPIQGNNIYKGLHNFPDEAYGSLRWWAVSSGDSGTHAHLDPMSSDVWNSLISGYKWWIIFPESVKDSDELSCKEQNCKNLEPTPTNWHASIGINVARFPYSDNEKATHVLQRPGETIYVPFGYVNSVYNLGETIAVTENYGSIGNLCRVWGELVTTGDSHHWKHAYYTQFNQRQRQIVRSTYFWPPEAFEDYAMDDDTVFGPLSMREEDMDEVPHHCPKYNY